MYNKLFTRILDSSIWMQPTATRIVWLTFIATMDEQGFCQFAAVANIAHRARVSVTQAQQAIACLEAPDLESSDPEHEGRRIERVPGGWLVLNSEKYRAMATRATIQAQTRARVRKHRGSVTTALHSVTGNGNVTPSESDTDTESESEKTPRSLSAAERLGRFQFFWERYPRKTGKGAAQRAFDAIKPTDQLLGKMISALEWQVNQPQWTKDGGKFIPHPATWLNQHRWEDEPFEPLAPERTPDRFVDVTQEAIAIGRRLRA